METKGFSVEFTQQQGLDSSKLPAHVGIIMDGNGRWATNRHLPRLAGHRKGVERVIELTEFASQLGLKAVTIYAFSDENWRRPEEEVSHLMGLLRWYIRAERARLIKNNIIFRVIGDRKKLSVDILQQIVSLEEATQSNTGTHLTVALSYGSRGEMIRAIQRMMADVKLEKLFPSDISEDLIDSYLDTNGLPSVDLLIRTSGEQRVSNFLLWQIAYAELYFEPCFWPDFSSQVFVNILKNYEGRERRFGLTPEQTKEGKKSAISR